MVEVQRKMAEVHVRDESALEIFRDQWQIYQKFVTHDYLENAGAYAELHRFLNANVARPFAFVDLACGDASGVVTALKGTEVAHYRGIDLAPPALEAARENLAALPCTVELEEADFVEAMRSDRGPADVVWISLSLHHLRTPDKLALMRLVRARVPDNGTFLIYEPTFREGEDRAAYLDRFEEIGRRDWTTLTDKEFEEAMRHVRACDLPETAADWKAMGREAGFAQATELYKAPSDLFRAFCYHA